MLQKWKFAWDHSFGFRSQEGKPPGVSQAELDERLNRIKASYGAVKEDFTKFPAFQFEGNGL